MASSARIEELRKKFEENPRRYFAPLANEYRKAGEVEQAIAICREYLPQQPGHMSGHIVYGQALYEARQVEEAKTVFETALSLDPENLIALRHLGDIALMVGDNAGARMWYGRVLEADPRNEEIQAQLASMDASATSASSAPTPAITPAIPDKPAAPAKPTPSSAPTVVMSAKTVPVPVPAQAADRPRDAVTPQSPTIDIPVASIPKAPPPVTATSPTAEIRLDSIPTAHAPPEIEKSTDMTLGFEPTSAPRPSETPAAATLEIDTPISASRESPPIDSFSLEGLQTTSLSAPPPPPPPPVAPPESDLDFGTAAAAPSSEAPAPLADLDFGGPPAPPPPAAQVEEMPLLDIGDIPAAAPAPIPAPAEPEAVTEPAMEWSAPPQPEAAPEPAAPESALEWASPPAPAPEAEPAMDWNASAAEVPAEMEPPAPAPESGPFVTETMAELYLKQGHREEALRVYRALLEQRPDDRALAAKVSALLPAVEPIQPGAAAWTAAQPGRASPGPTIRDLLNAIAQRRPGFRAELPHGNGGTPDASAYAPPAVSTIADLQDEQPQSEMADALATLFGNAAVGPADESAATALAQAFMDPSGMERGGSHLLSGAPARRASRDLSLDSVFQAAEPQKSSTFSFDQFFSQRATAEQAAQPGAPAASASEASDDVAQFTQWLEGLKQR